VPQQGVKGPMRFFKSAVLAFGMLLLADNAVFAQAAPTTANAPLFDLKPVGAGLVILGAALGIGVLAKSTVESMARQPEIAGNIQTGMIIAAALIEGVTFFALIIILLQVLFGG
jgi:F-type H+-transporting ATPase subunit c